MADRMVMASGLSSAFRWSDINGRSRETSHRTSNTPPEEKLKDSLSEVSPVGEEEQVTELKPSDGRGWKITCQQPGGVDFSCCGSALHHLLQVESFGGAGASSCHVTSKTRA